MRLSTRKARRFSPRPDPAMSYTLDNDGYSWRPRPAPFFGTRHDLFALFAMALMARINQGPLRGERPRRRGRRVTFPKGTINRHKSARVAATGPTSYGTFKAEQAHERAVRRAGHYPLSGHSGGLVIIDDPQGDRL